MMIFHSYVSLPEGKTMFIAACGGFHKCGYPKISGSSWKIPGNPHMPLYSPKKIGLMVATSNLDT